MVLYKFKLFFNKPKELPPYKSIYHRIHFLLEQNWFILNLQMPLFSKILNWKLIRKILQAHIIRSIKSSFSSLMILIRKKDGIWRIYVDYKALNHVVVLNHFKMPIVKELIDELLGACMFSKLDLCSRYYQIRMAEEEFF